MKSLAKLAAIVISAAMAVTAFGCGSGDATGNSASSGFEPQNIEVNDPGFSITEDGQLQYAFIAVNPNEGHVAQNVVFTIEAYDADGAKIAGGGETISFLYPDVETPGAGETELFSSGTDMPEVARLSIVPMMDSAVWSTTKLTADDCDAMFVINSPKMASSNGSLEIKATIQMAPEDEAPEGMPASLDARAVAILSDADGAVGGTTAVTFMASPDEPYSYYATIDNAPDYSECNLYVTPNALL